MTSSCCLTLAQSSARSPWHGIARWDDARLSGRQLGLRGEERRRVDAVLSANRAPGHDPVGPPTPASNVGNWLARRAGDVFVAVETVTDQGDDFARLPQRNATPMAYLIGWGCDDADGQWQSHHVVARDLTAAVETELIDTWRRELNQHAHRLGLPVDGLRLFHWGVPWLPCPEFNWFDLLENVIHKEPIAVRGAFDFKQADMAMALNRAGLIDLDLGDLPALPSRALSAMAGAWSAATEATERGCSLEQTAAMGPILRYATASCQATMQIVSLLRRRASRAAGQAA